MTPKTKFELLKILQFSALWVLFGLMYAVVEFGLIGFTGVYPTTQNVYSPKESFLFILAGTALYGAIVGVLESKVFIKLFRGLSFGKMILFKSVFYLALIIFFLISLSFVTTSLLYKTSVFDALVIESVLRFVTDLTFLTIVFFIAVSFIITLFFAQIRDYLGIFVFLNFITGKYHKPRIENRIFMFMDMKSSTTIAEKLGHVKYYKLLNQYYSDMSDAIINTYGEIYQYVGDEVIITWPLENGVKDNNCIRCFYEIKHAIEKHAQKYLNEFGLVPEFKAGLHCGTVTSGEVGKLKKEIVFSGDVLNTTSRIQEMCNEYEAELLVSQTLLENISISNSIFHSEIGEIELRGKQSKVTISKINLRVS